MPAEYEHSERIKDVAMPLIKLHHGDIQHAKIAFIMKLAPEDSNGPKMPTRQGKHPAMAKAKKVTPLNKVLSGFDFVLEVDETFWDVLNLDQQVALIDHELSHMAVDENGFYLKDHDFEEFLHIVERHGCWHSPLPELRTIMQGTFDFGDNVERIPAEQSVQ